MEKMEQNLCLDTDAVIAFIKGDKRIEPYVDLISSSKLFITSVTSFELSLREKNLSVINQLLNSINILSFNMESSKMASIIYKNLKQEGNLLDIRDIFIAATALVHNCSLLTFNRKHFERIKGLRLE